MARMIEMWKNFFVMFVYLWVLFGLFVLNEQVVYQKQEAPTSTTALRS